MYRKRFLDTFGKIAWNGNYHLGQRYLSYNFGKLGTMIRGTYRFVNRAKPIRAKRNSAFDPEVNTDKSGGWNSFIGHRVYTYPSSGRSLLGITLSL